MHVGVRWPQELLRRRIEPETLTVYSFSLKGKVENEFSILWHSYVAILFIKYHYIRSKDHFGMYVEQLLWFVVMIDRGLLYFTFALIYRKSFYHLI